MAPVELLGQLGGAPWRLPGRESHRRSSDAGSCSRRASDRTGVETVRVRSQPWIVGALAPMHPPPTRRDQPAAASRRRKKLLSAFLSAFRTPDLRKKLLFTVGDHRGLPARRHAAQPGRLLRATCRSASTPCSDGASSGVFTLLNLFSGGALLQLSVFALGIMPYITAQHHPAAADRRHPAAGAAEEGGPVRPGEDHPVHPLPDPRPGVLQSSAFVALARSGQLFQNLLRRSSRSSRRTPACPTGSP